jgi:small-conductance mechanosensitive channel
MTLRKLVGRYQPKDSFLHKLDPRTKIFAALVLALAVFFLDSLWDYLLFAGFILIAVMLWTDQRAAGSDDVSAAAGRRPRRALAAP